MKKIVILMVLTALNIFHCSANPSPNKLHFSGVIKDNSILEAKSVTISYALNGGFLDARDGVEIKSDIDEKGRFNFNLPDLGHPFAVGINIKGSHVKGTYFAESGDSIGITINFGTKEINFKGQGCEKYNVINELYKQFWNEFTPKLNDLDILRFTNAKELDRNLSNLSSICGEFEQKKVSLLNQNNKINENMKSIIKDRYALYNVAWSTTISYMLYRKNKEYRNQLKNYYVNFRDNFPYNPVANSVLSGSYMGALLEMVRFEIKIKNLSNTVDLVVFYNSVKERFTGIVRDRLLAGFAFDKKIFLDVSGISANKLDSIIIDAKNSVRDSSIIKALTDNLRLQAGTKILNVPFIDIEGKKFSMDSLGGKVYLVDIWFVGCTGCAELHKHLEEKVYPLLRKNIDFSVLSINMDRTNKDWIKGMNSGKYTTSANVNVTTGSGLDHPFMKYYNIQGGPFVMLVDHTGRIFSRLGPAQLYNVDYFIKLVKDALYKKNRT